MAGESFYSYEVRTRAEGARVCEQIQAQTPEALQGDSAAASDDADWVTIALRDGTEYRCELAGGPLR